MDMTQNRCSGCGGQIVFDPESGTRICSSCQMAQGSAESAADAGITNAFQCPNCAYELTTIPGSRQSVCDACDTTFNMISEDQDCELTGDVPDSNRYIEPFTVTKEAYQRGMISWLAGENFTPRDLFDKMAIINSEGCYVPYYHCQASYRVNWTASIGYDRIETYVVPVRTQNGTRMVTKTRVVTDWRPFSSVISGVATNTCEGTKYLEEVRTKTAASNTPATRKNIKTSSNGLADAHNAIQFDKKHKFSNDFTAGFTTLPCEIPSNVAYDKNKINAQIRRAITSAAPGDRIRDIRFSGDIIPNIFLIYRPTWVTFYSYDKKICFSTSDGANESRHFGTRPSCADKKKRIRNWLMPFIGSILLTILMFIVHFATLSSATEILFIGSAVTVPITGLLFVIMRFSILNSSKKALAGKIDTHIGNPTIIFSRRSAATHPMG